MNPLIKNLKKQKTTVFDWFYHHVVPRVDRYSAQKHIRALQRKTKESGQPVKVGFIVQMPELWNKQAPVYERMTRDPGFDPWLIVVPSYDLVKKQRGQYGGELQYFRSLYPEGQFLTSAELSDDFSQLKARRFDYIFYPRCWESYLPKSLRTRNVIRYAKTCYIPYAFHCFKPYPSYYQNRFFSSLYLMFCCSSSQQATAYPSDSIRKTVFLGFPCLEGVTAVPQPHTRVRLLWTPRWQSNPRYGGTTFFAFKDRFFELAEQHPELEIIMRPHPLTFENAVKTGKMTLDEVSAYKARCSESGIRFDANANIDDTLPEVDILLSDFSSILVDAAMLGKTIIYCGGAATGEYDETMEQIMQCAYHVDSWEAAVDYIRQLSEGHDPKREARAALAERLTTEHQNSSAAILQYLRDDAAPSGKR